MFKLFGGTMRHNLIQSVDFNYSESGNSENTAYRFFYFVDPVEFGIEERKTVTLPHAVVFLDQTSGFTTVSKSNHPIHYSWFKFTCEPDELDMLGIKPNSILYPSNPAYLFELTEKLQNLFFTKENDDGRGVTNEFLINETIKEILCLSVKTCRLAQGFGTITEKLVTIREKMAKAIDRHWTTDIMASEAGYCKFYFVRAYKKYFGISPNDDLIVMRISKAKEYLVTTNYNASKIAEKLGYTDYTHFSRQFRSKVGVSPIKYRTLHSE